MRVSNGTFIGAGSSALYIGLGFIPQKVVIRNIDQAAQEELVWNTSMIRAAAAAEGILRTTIGADDTGLTVLTEGNGIVPYAGGTVRATASANYIVPVNAEALFQGDMRQKTGTEINTWTLDTTGDESGHFNTLVSETYVGVGSRVTIEETSTGLLVQAAIVGFTSDGTADDDVILNISVASGTVKKISYKYDFCTAQVGTVMPQGIKVNDYTYVNVSAQQCFIDAGTYDTLY